MGLRSPFDYVNYEVSMAELLVGILDKLCAHCHTNRDYQEGCRSCPAGVLAFACRDYILGAEESDKRFELYASDGWQANRKEHYGHTDSLDEIAKNREIAQDYKPECEVLRAMKQRIKGIQSHPFFYVRHHRKYPYERPKALSDFVGLLDRYRELRKSRLERWGLGALV
jgi:hypothetical protein